MDIFLKAVALTGISVVLHLVLSKQNKDIAVILSIATCCLILCFAAESLNPVISFVERLESMTNLNPVFIGILLKSTGIGLLTQITVLMCNDAGNTALGKAIHILAVGTVLYLAIPLFSELIDLIYEILGGT